MPPSTNANAVPQCRMAGERDLIVRREDADVVGAVADRGHERRLGEPDLARECLHGLAIEAVRCVGHHTQLVAGERRLGEHVQQLEGNPHGPGVSQAMRLLGLGAHHAGVTQWQSSSLPSWLCGFDSRHPLHGCRLTPSGRSVPQPSLLQRRWCRMGRTLLFSVLTVALLGCSPSSDPSPATVDSAGEHSRVPNMVGDPFDVAVERLADNGLCVDRVEVLPPRRTDDPTRLTPGLILQQQPGPIEQGDYPYRITLGTFGGERIWAEAQIGRGDCPDPMVVRPGRPGATNTWWGGSLDDRQGLVDTSQDPCHVSEPC
jgi:hypothetical protein